MTISAIHGNGYVSVTGFDGSDWNYSTALGVSTPMKVDGVKLIPSASNQKVIIKADQGKTTNPIVGCCFASADSEPRVDSNFGQPFIPIIDGTLSSSLNATSVVVIYGKV